MHQTPVANGLATVGRIRWRARRDHQHMQSRMNIEAILSSTLRSTTIQGSTGEMRLTSHHFRRVSIIDRLSTEHIGVQCHIHQEFSC